MKDKFAEYFETRVDELSEYVHLNHRLIMVKMASEMRRKLDLTADMQNRDGYVSLLCSLQGRLFNECVYALMGYCEAFNIKVTEIIPLTTLQLLFRLIDGKIKVNKDTLHLLPNIPPEQFTEYYLSEIDELRKHLEALPKDT